MIKFNTLNEFHIVVAPKNDQTEDALELVLKIDKSIVKKWYYFVYCRRFVNVTYITLYSEEEIGLSELGLKYIDTFNIADSRYHHQFYCGKHEYLVDRQNETAKEFGGVEARFTMLNYFFEITKSSLKLNDLFRKSREEISIKAADEIFNKFGVKYQLYCKDCGNYFEPSQLIKVKALIPTDSLDTLKETIDNTFKELEDLKNDSKLIAPSYSSASNQSDILLDLSFQYAHMVYYQFGKSNMYICPNGHTICTNPGYPNFSPPWRR